MTVIWESVLGQCTRAARPAPVPAAGVRVQAAVTRVLAVISAALFSGAGGAGEPPKVSAALPAAVQRPVSFEQEIKPLLEGSCIQCHAHGQKKGGYQLDSREQFLKGGNSGAAAVAGASGTSLVVKLVAGQDPERVMPAKGPRLTAGQIAVLRAWIDQGLPWSEGIKLARAAEAPLEPRRPVVPRARGGLSHPIDRFLAPYFASAKFKPPKPVEDRLFARRVYLDVLGLPPTAAECEAFLADRRPDKRARLVQRMLADHQRYAEHWLTFWNDALRNDYRGTGYIDGGRKQITPWLYAALATNMPFDKFVARLVNPDEHSEGFTKGIVWRGVVNASQTPQLQAAQGISQVFLGINLKCASCHDSFISNWKLEDAYGLASVYADQPLELVRCDKPTGQIAARKFLYPQLGAVASSTNRAERLESLAGALTNPRNGRLTRTVVNRLWAKFLGRGLVEPVDEMDNRPWHRDLLDWLAVDLADHGYDLKHTMELILTSRAYQLPAVAVGEQVGDSFAFRGPVVRRLTAEQYLDALSLLTGTWRTLPANTELNFFAGREREPLPLARWVWRSAGAAQAVPPETVYLRRTIRLPEVPREAAAIVTADNQFTLYVNGHEAASGSEWGKPRVADLKPHLVKGENVFAIRAVNEAASKEDQSPNPAGLFFLARLRGDASVRRPAGKAAPAFSKELCWDFGSDASWLCTTNKTAGWEKPDFKPEGWNAAVELGDAHAAPWSLEAKLAASWSSAAQYGRVRAALGNNDPVMAALGRPNREQVMTARPSVATTMQALELTNGATLAELLERGARALLERASDPPGALAARLYLEALGRPPTARELELALEYLGPRPGRDGVADLLWAVSLSPEFQLIY